MIIKTIYIAPFLGGSVITESPKGGGSLKTVEGFTGGDHSNLLGK